MYQTQSRSYAHSSGSTLSTIPLEHLCYW